MSTLVVDNLPNQERRMATALVNFSGVGVVTIREAVNVVAVVDIAQGKYDPVFDVAMDTEDYFVGGMITESGNSQSSMRFDNENPPQVDRFSLVIRDNSSNSSWDAGTITVQVFGGMNP